MVRIPYTKIPSVRVGSIDPTLDIGTGGATPAPPTPITYLTQWQILGNSEVHTLPYPDGVVLPTGYKRCEYLTFDGSSYINTGVKTANNLTISVTWLTNVQSRLLLGARESVQSEQLTFGFFHDYNKLVFNYGTGYNYRTVEVNLADNVKHTAIIDGEGMTIDGVFYEQSSNELTDFFDIYLGSWNTNDNDQSSETRKFKGNIYDTIISNTQGELWHGIPCLDANDVPCFYDLVSETAFYNQGSGSFTYKLYPQPTEIWSCGEYNATDGKYHILVQPQGGSIADIALDAPLRKVNDVADTIEFPSETEGKALVTRSLKSVDMSTIKWFMYYSDRTQSDGIYCIYGSLTDGKQVSQNDNSRRQNILTPRYVTASFNNTYTISSKNNKAISYGWSSAYNKAIRIQDSDYNQLDSVAAFKIAVQGVELIYELATPTTELVDAPQIEEADSYSMVISQGGKAVEWSSFSTNSE